MDKFKEIGEITSTGTCNSYINDYEGIFVMGSMSASSVKLLNKDE